MEPLQDARRIAGQSADRIAEIAQTMQSNAGRQRRPVPLRRPVRLRLLARPDRRRGLAAPAPDLPADSRPPDLDRHHRAPARAGHRPGRQLRRRRPAPRLSAWGRSSCRRRRGHGRRSPSTPSVTEQSAEKTELASQKMIIGEVTGTAQTFGGYVNVSRQIIDWTTPQVMDIISATSRPVRRRQPRTTPPTRSSPAPPPQPRTSRPAPTPPRRSRPRSGVPSARSTPAPKAQAVSSPRCRRRCSASSARCSPRSTRRTPSRPGSAPSTTGRAPPASISGVPIYVTAGLADNKILVLSTAAAEVYEDRIGALSRRRARPRRPGRLRAATSPRWSSTRSGSSRSPRRHERTLGRPQPAGGRPRAGRQPAAHQHRRPPKSLDEMTKDELLGSPRNAASARPTRHDAKTRSERASTTHELRRRRRAPNPAHGSTPPRPRRRRRWNGA